MFIQTYASHVMQTALQQANKYLTESLEEPKDALKKRPDENPLEPLSTIINLFVENLMSQLVTVCTDVNGSHVLHPCEGTSSPLVSPRRIPFSPRPSTKPAVPFSLASQSWTPLLAIFC